jgi:hypothetical protein
MIQFKISFAGLITLILILLKVTGYLDVSWLIVLALVWIPVFVGILFIIADVLLDLFKP